MGADRVIAEAGGDTSTSRRIRKAVAGGNPGCAPSATCVESSGAPQVDRDLCRLPFRAFTPARRLIQVPHPAGYCGHRGRFGRLKARGSRGWGARGQSLIRDERLTHGPAPAGERGIRRA